MTGKKVTRKMSADSTLVTAAKSIGKAAGRIAFVVSAAAKARSGSRKASLPKRSAGTAARPSTATKQSKPLSKKTSKGAAASKAKTTRAKQK